MEAATAAGCGTQETGRRGDFPEVSGGEGRTKRRAVAMTTRCPSAVLHPLMLSCRLTSASWERQQMRVATETRRSP